MTEHIKRKAALAALYRGGEQPRWVCDMRTAYAAIETLPAADVALVVHGHWIEKEAPVAHKYFECSNCGAHENKHTAIKGYYCWRCGAKMDGGADREA